MLCLQLFAHGECDSWLIEHLVCWIGHVHFVAHSEQKQATLGLVQRDLTNDLVKALAEQLIAHWTKSWLARLPLEKLLVEHFTQSGNVDSCRRLVANVLDEVLALFDPLTRRQNRIQDIFGANRSIFHWWQRCFLHAYIVQKQWTLENSKQLLLFSEIRVRFKFAFEHFLSLETCLAWRMIDLLPKDFLCGFVIALTSIPCVTSIGLS